MSRIYFNLSCTEIAPNQTPQAPWQGKQTNNCSRELKIQRSTWRKKLWFCVFPICFKPEKDQKDSFNAETKF